MGLFPSCLRILGQDVTSKPLGPLVSSGKVECFHLQGCPVDKVNDNTLALLGNNAPQLRQLEIDCRAIFLGSRNGYNGSRQTTVTDAGFKLIAANCHLVDSLSLIWVRSLSDEGVADLCLQMRQLERVKLWWSNCTERVLLALSQLTALRELDLRTCKDAATAPPPSTTSPPPQQQPSPPPPQAVSPAPPPLEEVGLKRILTRCTALERLSLVDVQSCSDAAMHELGGPSGIRTLTHLFLSDVDVSNAGLDSLCGAIAPGLVSLHLSHLRSVTSAGLARLLAACDRLEHVELCWLPGVNDDVLVELAKRPTPLAKLRTVKLDGLKELTLQGLCTLVKSAPQLGYLQCFNSKCHSAQPLVDINSRLRVCLAAW